LLATLLVLSVLIVIHEFGHLLAAKRLGIKVLRFSIGFGPRLFGIEVGGTEYRLSSLPFGGYVRMAGEEGLAEPGVETETEGRFSAKPVWARSIVVLAGPMGNLVFAGIILFGIVYTLGIETYKPVVGQIEEGSPAASAGLLPGDRIISADGRSVQFWSDLVDAVAECDGSEMRLIVDRDGQRIEKALVPRYDETIDRWRVGVGPWVGTEVGTVRRGSPAAAAGIRRGDRITEVGGEPVELWHEMVEHIRGKAGTPVVIEWEHAGERRRAEIVPERVKSATPDGDVEEVGVIGVVAEQPRRRISLFQAVSAAAQQVWWWLKLIVMFLSMLFRGEVSGDSVSGPVWIGYLAGETARYGARSLLEFMAFLSANLALLNLLPLPILDGGQLVFFGIELARGKPLSFRRRLLIQQIGFLLIVVLFFYITYHDILRLISVVRE